jgi:hypothetical protein
MNRYANAAGVKTARLVMECFVGHQQLQHKVDGVAGRVATEGKTVSVYIHSVPCAQHLQCPTLQLHG